MAIKVDLGGKFQLTDILTPDSDLDAVNKQYVDSEIAKVMDSDSGNPYLVVNSTLSHPTATGGDSIALGPEAEATGGNAIAIGHHTGATADDSIHIGADDDVGGGVDPESPRGIAIGHGARVWGNSPDGIAIGTAARMDNHENSIALGNGAEVDRSDQFVLGGVEHIKTARFHPSGTRNEYITVDTDGNWGFSDGELTYLDINQTGNAANATGNETIAIGGGGALAEPTGSIALGYGAVPSSEYETRIATSKVVVDTDYTVDGDYVLTTKKYVDDNSNDTTYTAGYGLDLNDTEFSVDTDVIADTEWVKQHVVDNSTDFGYQNLFTDATELQRYPTSHDAGHEHFASDGTDIRWFYSQETVFDTDLPVGATIRVNFVAANPIDTPDQEGYYSILSLDNNILNQLYTLNLEHIEGDDPLADRSNALDTENHYEFKFSYENRAAGRTFNGHRTGYVPAPSGSERNSHHYFDGNGNWTAFDSDRFIAGDNITIEDSDNKVKISSTASGGGFNADTDRIAIGNNAAADSDHAIAIGVGAIARGENSIVLGQGVKAHVDGRTLTFNIDGLSPEDPGTISYEAAQIDGVNASATNSFTFANGSVIDIDNAGDNLEIVLTQAWTIDDTEGTFTGQGVSSFLLGNASVNLVEAATYEYAVAINADAEADSELVIGKVNTIRTPDFTGGSNQYIAVNADGVWTTEAVSASIDSDNFIAGANVDIDDSDGKVKISATVDGGADNILVRNRQDDGDTAYIDVLLTSGGSQIGSVERIVTEGFGTVIEAGAAHTMSVDTEVIADTEWVKDNFSGGSHRSVYVESANGDTSPLVYIKHDSDDTVKVHTVDSEYAGTSTGEIEAAIYTSDGQLTLDAVGQNQSVPFDTDGTDVYVVTDTYTAIISGKPDNVGNDPVEERTFFEWNTVTIIGKSDDHRGKTYSAHTLSSVHTGKLGFTMADTDWIKTNTQAPISGGDGINIVSDTEVEVDDGFGLNFDTDRQLQVDVSQIATHSYVQSAVRNATRGEVGNRTDEHTLYLTDNEHDQLRFENSHSITGNRSYIVNTRGDTVYQGIAARDDDLFIVQTIPDTDSTETVLANSSRNWEAVQYGVYEGNRWDESDAFTYHSQAFKYTGDAPTTIYNSEESVFSNVTFYRNGHNSGSTYQVTARVQLGVVDDLSHVRSHSAFHLIAESEEFTITLSGSSSQITESPVRLPGVDSDSGVVIQPDQYVAVRWAIHIDHYDDDGVSLTDAPYLVWSGTGNAQRHHTGRADVRTVTYELYLDPADGTVKYGNNTRTPELIERVLDTDGQNPWLKVHSSASAAFPGESSMSLGGSSNASHTRSIALGYQATTTRDSELVIGSANSANSIHHIRTPHFRSATNDKHFITVDTDGVWGIDTETAETEDTEGTGISLTVVDNKQQISVDTDVIADTEFVKYWHSTGSVVSDITNNLGTFTKVTSDTDEFDTDQWQFLSDLDVSSQKALTIRLHESNNVHNINHMQIDYTYLGNARRSYYEVVARKVDGDYETLILTWLDELDTDNEGSTLHLLNDGAQITITGDNTLRQNPEIGIGMTLDESRLDVDTELMATRDWVESIVYGPDSATTQREAAKLFKAIGHPEVGEYSRLRWNDDNSGYQIWFDVDYADDVDATHNVEIVQTDDDASWILRTEGVIGSGTFVARRRKTKGANSTFTYETS